ncbi:MAG: wax ester/triacylglycerol synthase family O-acyltransferase [Myxococcota bacterium]
MSHAPRSHEPMSPLDELLFRSERDPVKRPTMAAIFLLDGTPEWDRIEETFERASREYLRLRQRVVEPTAGFGPACWTTDPDFDLAYHLRRARLAPGATVADIVAWLEPELMTPLDASRPLWTATFFEGLEGGRAALVFKISHALSDGVGGIQIHAHLFDLERDAPRRPMPPLPLCDDATPDELATEELGRVAGHAIDLASKWVHTLANLGDRLLGDPRGALEEVLEDVVDHASSALRVLDSGAPASPLLAGRSRRRRLLWLDLSLPRLKAAAKGAGGTLNDAYLAGLCGALARYHEALFMPVEALPLGLPISTRRPGDEEGGNRFVAAVLAAPLAERDAAARMKAIAEQMRQIRAERGIDYAEWTAPWLVALPASLSSRVVSVLRPPDVQASNVPGPRDPIFFAGTRVERMLGIGPLPGAAMMATFVTLAGTATLTIHYDPAAVRDAPLLLECLREAFAEVELLGVESGGAAAAGRP